MDFETFAKLYAALRFKLGRGDDLLEATVARSEAFTDASILGADGRRYHLVVSKDGDTATLSIRRRSAKPVIRATATLSTKTVVLDKRISALTLHEMFVAFANHSQNGRETMAYFDDNHRADTPLEEAAEDRGTAEKAARLILAGIGKYPELDPSETFLVVQAMIAVLADPNGMNRTGRVQNALGWALHPDTQPEWAIYLASWIRQNIPVENQNSYSLDVLAERYPGL